MYPLSKSTENFKKALQLANQAAAEVGDVVALGADGFTPGFKAVRCINQLHLIHALNWLVFVQNPDVGADAGVHKLVSRKLDDCIEPVILKDVLTDVRWTAPSITGKQRRAILNDRHLAVSRELGKTVEHKELLAVRDLW